MDGLAKDRAVLECLAVMRASGVQYVVVDHWEDDLEAVGIAAPDDPRRLVYICTHDQPLGACYAELEAPVVDDASEWTVVGRFDSISYDDLVDVARNHLQSQLVAQ